MADPNTNQNPIVELETTESGPVEMIELVRRYKEQGVDIRIRSNSPAVDELIADAKPTDEKAHDKSYDEGGTYDKIYQRYDKS